MATVMTHALVGGALTTLRPQGVPATRLALVLAALSMAPDLDVIGFALGIPYGHPLGHRGITHGLPFAMLAGAVAPWLLGVRRGAPGFMHLWVLGSISVASHGVFDALTNGGKGVGFFIPFHQERYFFPWQPLRVSPIGVEAFLRGRVWLILRLEWVYVLAPALAFFTAAAIGRWAWLRRT